MGPLPPTKMPPGGNQDAARDRCPTRPNPKLPPGGTFPTLLPLPTLSFEVTSGSGGLSPPFPVSNQRHKDAGQDALSCNRACIFQPSRGGPPPPQVKRAHVLAHGIQGPPMPILSVWGGGSA